MGRLKKFKSFMKGMRIGLLYIIGIVLTTILIGETAVYLGPILGVPTIWLSMAIIGVGFIIMMGFIYATTDY